MADRRFSLEDDFMNYKTNDLLYAFMRGLSTARPIMEDGECKGYQEYLTKKNFVKNKKTIAAICGCTTHTIGNHIKKLFEVGLLDEGFEIVEVNGKEYEYDVFWFPYDEDTNYKLVNKEFIKYLVDTRNAHAIRIYLYLLNKYQWKKGYIFTKQEIKEALGYAASTKSADESIGNVLKSFAREGVIKYKKVIENEIKGGKVIPVERFELNFVATKESELRKLSFE